MLALTPKGLYCQPGNFFIDPNRGVENAVVTHAHSDHARRGSERYFCAASCEGLLRARLGRSINVSAIEFGRKFRIGEVFVSFHPAGHILGSAQVRLEYDGEVWVVSGDYKREPDPTCEPFEVVKCDVFISEATFGTPSFTWPKNADPGGEIFRWWEENVDKGVNSVLFAYSLGKTQRVLGLLEPLAKKPILCPSSAMALNECYRAQNVKLASTRCLSDVHASEKLEGELFLVPTSFLDSPQARLLGDRYETAFASGWMARGPQNFDRGFLLSDHADWNDLVSTIQATEAKAIYVQHRGNGALVRHLRNLGLSAFPESELGVARQLELF